MGIDINLFRTEKGNDPEKIREIQKKRFKKDDDLDRVDVIVKVDKEWRETDYKVNQLNKEINQVQKDIGKKMKNKEPCEELMDQKLKLKKEQEELDILRKTLHTKLQVELRQIGNLLHDDVVISNNEDDNKLIRSWG